MQIVNGALQIGKRQNNSNDLFEITNNSDKTYTIKNNVYNLVIDVPNSKAKEAVVPIAFSYHGGNNQKWRFYINDDDSYSIATSLDKTLSIYTNSQNQYLSKYSSQSLDNKFFLIPASNINDFGNKMIRFESKADASKYIDIIGGVNSATTSANIGSFTKNGGESDNQTFYIKKNGNNDYYKIINTATGLAISITDNVTKNGSYLRVDLNKSNGDINIYTYHGGDNQKWSAKETTYRQLEEGSYYVSSSINADFRLKSSGYLNNILLTANSNDKFTFNYNSYLGYYTIYTQDGNVLDVANGSTNNGAAIISFTYHGGCNQRWNLHKYDDGSYSISPFCINKNLELWGSNIDLGRINIWDKHDSSNQRWVITR